MSQDHLTNTEEIWKPVVGFEDFYEVSNLGRIRGLIKGGILRPCTSNKGYLQVCIFTKNYRKLTTIHKIVAAAFIGPKPEKMVINHKDGIKTNNRPENLEYISYSANNSHAFKMGLKKNHGQHASKAKLTQEQVDEIKKYKNIKGRFSKATLSNLSDQFGVSPRTIKGILSGETWNIE